VDENNNLLSEIKSLETSIKSMNDKLDTKKVT